MPPKPKSTKKAQKSKDDNASVVNGTVVEARNAKLKVSVPMVVTGIYKHLPYSEGGRTTYRYGGHDASDPDQKMSRLCGKKDAEDASKQLKIPITEVEGKEPKAKKSCKEVGKAAEKKCEEKQSAKKETAKKKPANKKKAESKKSASAEEVEVPEKKSSSKKKAPAKKASAKKAPAKKAKESKKSKSESEESEYSSDSSEDVNSSDSE